MATYDYISSVDLRLPLYPDTKPSEGGVFNDINSLFTALRLLAEHLTVQEATYLTDAPSDGSIYGRQDGDWVVVTGGSGIVESIIPGTGIAVDSTDPANPIVSATGGGGGGGADYKTTARIFEDFVGPIYTSTNAGASFIENSPVVYTSGTGSGFTRIVEAAAVGTVQLDTGTVAGNRSRLALGVPQFSIGNPGELAFRARIKIPVASVTGQEFNAQLGFIKHIVGVTEGNAIVLNPAVSNTNWSTVTFMPSGTNVVVPSSVPVAINTWMILEVIYSADGLTFTTKVDGVTLHTGSVAASGLLVPHAYITKVTGTTSRSLVIDYIEVIQKLSPARP